MSGLRLLGKATRFRVLRLDYAVMICACPPALSLRRGGRVTSPAYMKAIISILPWRLGQALLNAYLFSNIAPNRKFLHCPSSG